MPYKLLFLTCIYIYFFFPNFPTLYIANAIEKTIPIIAISGIPLLVFGSKSTVARIHEPINKTHAINANTNNLVTVTPKAVGSATITVAFTPTDTDNYNNAASKTYAVTVANKVAAFLLNLS